MFSLKLNKYQKNYDYLVSILKNAGLDTEDKLQTYLNKIFSRAQVFSVVIVALLIFAYFVSPKYFSLWGILGVLALAWGWSSALSAHKIIKQYIREELS